MMHQVRREESLGHSLNIYHYLRIDRYEEIELEEPER